MQDPTAPAALDASHPLVPSPPHPDSSSSSTRLPRSASANLMQRTDVVAEGATREGLEAGGVAVSMPKMMGNPTRNAVGETSDDGIRLVGSYDSTSDVAPLSLTSTSPYETVSVPPPSAAQPDTLLSPSSQPNKLAKWLSRSSASTSSSGSSPSQSATGPPESPTKTRKTRSRSIGSLNLLTRSVNRPPEPEQSTSSLPPPAAPTISISSSPSTQFDSQPPTDYSSTSALPAPSTSSAPRRSSVTSTSTSSSSAHSRPSSSHSANSAQQKRSLSASLSLRPSSSSSSRRNKKGKSPAAAHEAEDEWATAELEEGDEDGRRISEAMVRAVSRTSTVSALSGGSSTNGPQKGEGRLARGLRKTRSGLKLFGRAKEQAAQEAEGVAIVGAGHVPSNASSSMLDVSSGVESAVTPTSSSFPSSVSPMSDSALSTSPPPLSGSLPSTSGAPLSPNHNVANRIGGWFSSMLHPSTSAGGAAPFSGQSEQQRGSTTSLHSSPEKMRSPPSRQPGSPSAFALRQSTTSASPLKKGSSSSTTGQGRLGPFDRMLDRAVQYFLDTDSQADKCEEDIWVLGVRHPGWRAEADETGAGEEAAQEEQVRKKKSLSSLGRKGKSPVKARKVPPVPSAAAATTQIPIGDDDPFLVSTPTAENGSTTSLGSVPSAPPSTINGWPAAFYHDSYSRIALTYRSGFPIIPCDPSSSSTGVVQGMLNNLSMSIGRGGHRGPSPTNAEGGLSSDTGWGCMLRTGQSLLANALVKVHLGRDWRRPLPLGDFITSSTSPVPSAATYARILSLFLDDPSPISPFSVHRFAQQGKVLGKEIGEWFGPSTAAGAIKTLVNAYEPAGLKVVSCVDGTVYESEVVAASTKDGEKWKTPVLVLINVRLGIDGVNPIYYEAIKGIFRLPQSVGIAGGRPSSSYYFVGAQANSLFYIDPHHPRPAVPLVLPPDDSLVRAAQHLPLTPSTADTPAKESARQLDDFLLAAYPDAAWATYHTDKVRKCALSSLDPSMLLGFLVEDERDWQDFRLRVQELSQASSPIFAIAPSPPSWMRRSTSSAAPATVSALSPTIGDDSFSEVAGEDVADADSAGFSEPEDWELQSTEGEEDAPESTPVVARKEPSAGLGGAAVVVGEASRSEVKADEGWQGV
ncbi:Cysteine protease atg4 [Rhodotorula toruloides]|uniref:Autophagy-related protein 4 n=1 Tax=Rhodotorula toruloides TaxID=5286 RepID=A0A2T0AEQ9_RHOTO|nr:cysteine protease ATG4 [Rhodotorula toruloides]